VITERKSIEAWRITPQAAHQVIALAFMAGSNKIVRNDETM
jgi:hypothetical protein